MKKTVRCIRWKDASFQDSCNAEGPDIDDFICESVGFVVREDKGLIVLAMEWCENENTKTPYRHIIQIPKVSII